jgi:uncharacterized protein YegL
MALALSCTPLHEVRPSVEASDNALLLRVEAPGPAAPRTLPLAFAILLDTSGSMEGPRLERAVEGILRAVSHLAPTDSVALIGFDSRARVLRPLAPLGAGDALATALRRVRAGGATRLVAGLEAALDQLRAAQPHHALRRLILISDGAPSHGPRDVTGFSDHLRALHEAHVSISTVGLGDEFDEELLAGLAASTGGRYAYVMPREDPAEALLQAIQAVNQAALADATMSLRCLRWNNLQEDGGMWDARLPDIRVGSRYEAVVPLSHEPRPAGDYVVATVAVTGSDPTSGETVTLDTQALVAFWPHVLEERPPDAEVTAARLVRGGEGILTRTIADIRARRLSQGQVTERIEGAGAAFAAGGRQDLADRAYAAAARFRDGALAGPNKWLTEIVLDVRIGPAP